MTFDENLNSDEQRPIQQTFLGSLRRDTHWKCLVLTLMTWLCFASVMWCRFSVPSTSSRDRNDVPTRTWHGRRSASACAQHYIYIPVSFLVLVYLVYLVECWHSHTRTQLQYKVDARVVYSRMRAMREAAPHVWWRAICYHYVRRTRHVTRYRNGDAFTTTRVHYERLNSHSARASFDYTQCGARDLSMPVSGLQRFAATKIRISKGFSFACARSENEYQMQRAAFFRNCSRRDDYMEVSEGMELSGAGFKPTQMIAFADANNLPWYVSHVTFWFCSALLLSWPLRVLIEYRTARLHYHVHKIFGTNYLNDFSGSSNMSRTITVGSASEMERHILDNNYAIAPSYSEAILMDSVGGASTATSRDTNGNITSSISFPHQLGLLTRYNGKPRRAVSYGYVPAGGNHLILSNSSTRHTNDSPAEVHNNTQRASCSQSASTSATGSHYDVSFPVGANQQPRRGILSYVSNAFFPTQKDDQNVALLRHKRKKRCLRPAYTEEARHQDALRHVPSTSSSTMNWTNSVDNTELDEMPPSYEAALTMGIPGVTCPWQTETPTPHISNIDPQVQETSL